MAVLKEQLYHFSTTDPSARKAADFLLENLPYHSFQSGKKMDSFMTALQRDSGDKMAMAGDIERLQKESFPPDTLRPDTDGITASYLQSTIGMALERYKSSSWKKEVPFDRFCNYILPYRIENEPANGWREYWSAVFQKDAMDTMLSNKSLAEASEIIHRWLYERKKKYVLRQGVLPDLPPYYLNKLEGGSCHELAPVGVAVLRTLGIPATIDFTPMFLNFNNGHEWCAIVVSPQKSLIFDISDSVMDHHDLFYKYSKVYRKSFKAVKPVRLDGNGRDQSLPPFLGDGCMEDVTQLYARTSTIRISFKNRPVGAHDYAYLSVFTTDGWSPVALGDIKDTICSFSNVGRGGVYLPMMYVNGRSIPVSAPIVLEDDGSTRSLPVDKNDTESVDLERKFPMNDWKNIFLQRMVGGKFQGSDDPDFSKAEDLYVVKSNPGEHFHEVLINNKKSFKYVRYFSPPGAHGNIADMAFYGNQSDQTPIQGTIIGTDGSWANNPACRKMAAFDGNPLTYFDAMQADGVWAGLELGKSQQIRKIRFIARNDLNSIQKGNLYNLFYWDNAWISLGAKTADTTYLRYNNVPKGALLWLRNMSEGIEERIFTYENRKQIWW